MLSLLTLKEPTTNLWKGPRGKGLWVASGRQSNLWLTSSKRTGVPSNTTVRKWTASGNSELTFPSWTSRWGHSWLALWSPALWAPEQRTQLKCTRFLSYGDREIINLYFSQLLSLRWSVLQSDKFICRHKNENLIHYSEWTMHLTFPSSLLTTLVLWTARNGAMANNQFLTICTCWNGSFTQSHVTSWK